MPTDNLERMAQRLQQLEDRIRVLESFESGPSGGGGVTTFLALSDTPNSYASQGRNVVRVNAGTTALEFYSSRVAFAWHITGNLAEQDQYGQLVYPVDRGLVFSSIDITAPTPPTGAAAIFDIEWASTTNGSWTTIFSTRPQVDAGASDGGGAAILSVTSISAGSRLRLNIDQIGSGTPGADFTILLSAKEA